MTVSYFFGEIRTLKKHKLAEFPQFQGFCSYCFQSSISSKYCFQSKVYLHALCSISHIFHLILLSFSLFGRSECVTAPPLLPHWRKLRCHPITAAACRVHRPTQNALQKPRVRTYLWDLPASWRERKHSHKNEGCFSYDNTCEGFMSSDLYDFLRFPSRPTRQRAHIKSQCVGTFPRCGAGGQRDRCDFSGIQQGEQEGPHWQR